MARHARRGAGRGSAGAVLQVGLSLRSVARADAVSGRAHGALCAGANPGPLTCRRGLHSELGVQALVLIPLASLPTTLTAYNSVQ